MPARYRTRKGYGPYALSAEAGPKWRRSRPERTQQRPGRSEWVRIAASVRFLRGLTVAETPRRCQALVLFFTSDLDLANVGESGGCAGCSGSRRTVQLTSPRAVRPR